MNYFKTLISIVLLSILGCVEQKTTLEDSFPLLPSVEVVQFETTHSSLAPEAINTAFSPTSDLLPVRYGYSKQFKQITQMEDAQLFFSIQPQENQKAESYTLKIEQEKIEIQAQDQAGLFYAFVTLDQLIEDAVNSNTPLPLVTLQDAPKIAFRPIQVDVKHHLEKKSYYYDLIDALAQLKINGIILEIEDKLKYKRRPEVASADALSIEEWRALSTYALARNISISPLVQGLGHASFILKHDKNKHLRDDPKSDWAFNPLNPETYALQYDLYLDAMEAFPHGKYLHVGGDEVQTTGRGSGKSALELNLIWLNKVSAFAAEHDRIPIFWDDMPLKQAGLMQPIYDTVMDPATVDSIWEVNEPKLNKFITQFPKNCVYMRWNYHKAESYGNGKAMDWFSSNGFRVMGATAGQTRWTLMPQRESNIDQIRIFAEQSINRNYNGLLLTLWDDDSPHFELYKRGVSAFAEYSWGGPKRTKEEFKAVYRHRKFGSEFKGEQYAFIDALDEPVALWTNLFVEAGNHRNALIHKENPIEEQLIDLPDFNKKGDWTKKYSARLEQLEAQKNQLEQAKKTLFKIQNQDAKSEYNLAVYNEVIQLVKYNFELMSQLKAFDTATTPEAEKKALDAIMTTGQTFSSVRAQMETVYSQTRVLNKPEGYLLDQDHHNHPANQTVNFDWQFIGEILMLQKIQTHFQSIPYSAEGKKTTL
ncbi:MAG: glycoside hydrolase family 20 zincin-like fold domain-containing protein [Flavobacteriaceae bacterium]|nr:glycoside hydrolase family 20 zincin-like fold domain-containing protein [Flavobacteriaceae bacterium]